MDHGERVKTEQSFIALLLRYKDLVDDWIRSPLEVECFEECHIPILEAIRYSFSNNVLLTKASYIEFLRKKGKNKVEISNQEIFFTRFMAAVSRASKDDFPTLKEKIMSSYLMDNARVSIEEFVKNSKEKDSLYSLKKLYNRIGDLVSDNTSDTTSAYINARDYVKTYTSEVMADSLREDDPRLLTGIKEIDETMDTGLTPGDITLFCSDVGGGKSTIMQNVGMNVWLHSNQNVLFVPLEMAKKLVMHKMFARETSINSRLFSCPRLLNEEQKKKITEFSNFWENKEGGQWYWLDVSNRIPVSIIRRQIEKHVEIFQPKLIIVDYVAGLVPEKGSQTERNDLQIGDMLKDMKAMGMPGASTKEGFHVISAAQIGREALKRIRKMGVSKTSFYSEDLRGSHELSADASNIYAQMPDESNPNQLNFYCIKTRMGAKVFPNGTPRAVLDWTPEYSLIKSKERNWSSSDKEEIVAMVNETQTDLEEEISVEDSIGSVSLGGEQSDTNDPDMDAMLS